MPLVSVVIPSHNRALLLERTLRSVLAQAAGDLEVVVVDDGSTDATREVAAAAGPRVVLLRNDTPAGVSVARNQGIAAARGEWIAFCDDDDLWSPHKLMRQLAAADDARAHWVYGGDVNVDDGLRVLSGGPPPDPDTVIALLPRWNPIASGGSNVMVRAAVLREVGGFDPGLRRTEDWDLWIRIARTGRPAWVCEPLVAYRFHAGNVVAHPQEMVDEARHLAVRYGIPVDIAAMHRRAAWASLRSGRRRQAVQHYAMAIARGDLRSIGRAAVAIFHPRLGGNGMFRFLRRDPSWIARAEPWLQTFAAGSGAKPVTP